MSPLPRAAHRTYAGVDPTSSLRMAAIAAVARRVVLEPASQVLLAIQVVAAASAGRWAESVPAAVVQRATLVTEDLADLVSLVLLEVAVLAAVVAVAVAVWLEETAAVAAASGYLAKGLLARVEAAEAAEVMAAAVGVRAALARYRRSLVAAEATEAAVVAATFLNTLALEPPARFGFFGPEQAGLIRLQIQGICDELIH